MIRRSFLAATAIVLVACTSAAGAPSWNAPVQISGGDRALGPELALNAAGDALAAWDQEVGAECPTQPANPACVHIVQAAPLTHGSAVWGAPVEISRPGVDSRPTTAIGDAGDAAIAWVHDIGRDRVLQASYRRGLSGAWPEPNDLSEPTLEVRDHAIAVDAAGNAVTAWAERPETSFVVKAVTRSSASGVWGGPVRLSSADTASAGPSLALASNGTAVVAWVERGALVRVAQGLATTGTWQPPVDLSSPATAVSGAPQVAVAASGAAAVAWVQRTGGASSERVQVAYRPAGGNWAASRALDTASGRPASAADVGVDGKGDVVAVWLSDGAVEASARSAATGAWARTQIVATSSRPGTRPQLAVGPSGNAVTVWTAGENGVIRTAIRPGATGAWQRPVDIPSSDSSGPRVSLDGAGNGHAVWNETSGTPIVVKSARLVGNGPVLGPLRAPKRVARGVRARFSIDAAAWAAPLTGTPRWSFGDGATASGASVLHAYSRAGRYQVSVSQTDATGQTSTKTATLAVGAPRSTIRPSISGRPRVGTTVTCVPGSWAGARPLRLTYRWLRDGSAIQGATRSGYRVRAADRGHALACRVRATNAVGATTATSRPVLVDS